MSKPFFHALLLISAVCATSNATRATKANDRQVLLKALPSAKIGLQQAIATSEMQGQPISAKFEFEDGKLLLSVYTAKAGKFSEALD